MHTHYYAKIWPSELAVVPIGAIQTSWKIASKSIRPDAEYRVNRLN